MNTADKFLERLTSGWGERDVYSINEDEAETLISLGATKGTPKDNTDGTFSTQLEFRGKKFLLITTKLPK